MICTFNACPHKGGAGGGGMGSESDERSSLSHESVFSEEAGSGSSGLACSSSASNSASSSRENSFDDFRSDSCSSDYCDEDELESDYKNKLFVSTPANLQRRSNALVAAGQQGLTVSQQHDKNDLLFRALQCRWLLLRDQLQLESEEARESLFENAYLMLGQDLQPISPATDIPESVRIFEEHKAMAKEYLQAEMDIEDLLQTKRDLEKQLEDQKTNGPRGMSNHEMMKEWRQLQSENEGLVQFHMQLKKQLDLIKGKKPRNPREPPTPEGEPEPGWVMVPRRES